MGQKVNPHGLRVGIIKDWDSKWFANSKDFGDQLVEDYNIRKFIKKTCYDAGVAKIVIEDATFNEISTQFEKGAISVSHFREELVKLMSANAIGSEGWNQYLTAYLSSFDTESTKLQNKLEMLNDDDYVGQLEVTQQQIDTKGQKLAAIEAAGIAQYGDQYNREEDANWLTAQSDLLKSYQQLSQILNYQTPPPISVIFFRYYFSNTLYFFAI